MIKETSKVEEYKFGYYITEFQKKPEIIIYSEKRTCSGDYPHNDYGEGWANLDGLPIDLDDYDRKPIIIDSDFFKKHKK